MVNPVSISNAPLGALRAFESAARLGSFKAAAAELYVTPAAISHQIQALEDYLGVALFQRLNRAVRLTDKGSALAEVVCGAFARLDVALATAAPLERRQRDVLSISSVPSFASRWLAPRLHRFYEQHPEIDLRLASSDTLVDLNNDASIDIALRYALPPFPGLHALPLSAGDLLVPVCSPALQASLPRELTLVDATTQIKLLRVALPPTAATPGRRRPDNIWTQWLAQTALSNPALHAAAEAGPLYSVTHLAIEAAIAGRGVALAPRILVADDLAAGRLVQLGSVVTTDQRAHWLLCRKDKQDLPKVQAFGDWLQAELASATT
ncbi:LysR substrate-binding domain-containing protein [Chitinimonas sp.]|uniref:LysR substrate-binding domain-containing protein n=1 Tax=Chitinimonas sp. TaxID=1934313 RepID=UPI002F939C1B